MYVETVLGFKMNITFLSSEYLSTELFSGVPAALFAFSPSVRGTSSAVDNEPAKAETRSEVRRDKTSQITAYRVTSGRFHRNAVYLETWYGYPQHSDYYQNVRESQTL